MRRWLAVAVAVAVEVEVAVAVEVEVAVARDDWCRGILRSAAVWTAVNK